MSTQLFFNWYGASSPYVHRGDNDTPADIAYPSGALGWQPFPLTTGRGSAAQTRTANTVNGATAGVPINGPLGGYAEWISDPIDADTTISGTITFNLRSLESSMSANVAINACVYKVAAATQAKTLIVKTARTTELGTSEAAANFTATPTSTALNKGDRILVVVFGDDAGTMATGFNFSFVFAGPTGGATGDSYITFTETFGFLTTTPAGTTLYLRDDASVVDDGTTEKLMFSTRGSGVVGPVTADATTGWAAPVPIKSGGLALHWFSRPLDAFTLSGLVLLNIRASSTNSGSQQGLRAELAVCDGNGTNAVVWATACWLEPSTNVDGSMGLNEAARQWWLAGDDTSVASGQRLRLIVYGDDSSHSNMLNTGQARMWYNGTSGGASGDSYITLSQSVTEQAESGGDTDRLQALYPAAIWTPPPGVHARGDW